MKKHLLFALGIACAATCLTACHDNDDEDGDGNVASDFSGNVSVGVMPAALSQYTDQTGIVTYLLSDGNIQVFHYTTGSSENNPVYNSFFSAGNNVETEGEDSEADESIAVEKSALDKSDFPNLYEYSDGNYFYGGFTPTWTASKDDDAYDFVTPIDGTYGNNYNCLLANPGTLCKALFTKNFSSLMANATMKKIVSVNVQAPKIFDSYAQKDTANLDAWSLPKKLPANIRIEAVAYGYVKSFSIKNLKSALSALKSAASGIAAGGEEEGAVTLIETDANGNVTNVCNKWETIKFGTQTYLGEIYIRVIDKSTGKTAATDYLGTEGDYSMLNYVLVDKITFEGRSLLNLF